MFARHFAPTIFFLLLANTKKETPLFWAGVCTAEGSGSENEEKRRKEKRPLKLDREQYCCFLQWQKRKVKEGNRK